MNFPAPLDLRWLDGTHFVLLRPFTFRDITALAGFVTDFASIPRLARLFWSPSGPIAGLPSVIHDWGYAIGTRTRAEWDAIFYEALLVRVQDSGGGWRHRFRAGLMYDGVRLGGSFAWRRHRQRREQAAREGLPYPPLVPLTTVNDLGVQQDLETAAIRTPTPTPTPATLRTPRETAQWLSGLDQRTRHTGLTRVGGRLQEQET